MTPSSSPSCPACGTANPPQTTHCSACGHLFTTESGETVLAPAPSASQPAPSALLAGRYHVIGMVGEGSFGAVYKAEDMRRNDALVAIKEITLGGLSQEEAIEATDAFHREVRLLSGLEHPNLPHIYEHFTDAEHWYLAMDFIEGQTLQEYLKHSRRTYLPVAEVLDIGMQLCAVLYYLHTRQPPIILGDVKPANIMRTPSGHLFLIDFGIARHLTPGPARDTSALGSPGSAAPEQYGNVQTTVQSDIYSLGATLQTLLTGKDPLEPVFGYASPYAEDQDVPAALELLLGQMCDADVGQRPRSMEAVNQVLQQIQEELRLQVGTIQQTPFPVRAAGQALQPAPRRGVSRRAVIIGLVGVVGVATIGGGIAGWTLYEGLPPLYTYRGHSDAVNAVVWSPDGKRIASGSWDNTVQVWDAADGSHVYTYHGHAAFVRTVAWSPDGRRIASGGDDKTVQVWDAADGSHAYIYYGHSDGVGAVAWSPDGKRIASGSVDHTVQVWDAADGSHAYTYRGHSDLVRTVAWSPDGKRIASGSWDNTVQVWDAADGSHVYTYRGHADAVFAVAWSPDGKRIASGGGYLGTDTTVQVWDAADGSHVYTYRGHSSSVYAVAWSPSGQRIASGSGDKTVQVWDAADGSHIYTYRRHSGDVNTVAWSPDGQRIASGGGYLGTDNTVQVWDAADGSHAYTYQGHSFDVDTVAWSPDGKRIASGSFDETVQVWSAP